LAGQLESKKKKKLKKYPFFIYWLLAKTNHFWTQANIKESLKGNAKLEKGWLKKIDRVLDELIKG